MGLFYMNAKMKLQADKNPQHDQNADELKVRHQYLQLKHLTDQVFEFT